MSANIEYCPTCGTKLEGSITYNFCPHCGANFSEMNAEPSETVVVEPSEPVVVESSEPVVVESNTNKNNDDNEESDSSKSSKKIFIVAAIILLIFISRISINSINKQLEPKYDVISLTKENYKQYLQAYTEDVSYFDKGYSLTLVIHSMNDSYIFENVTVRVHTQTVSYSTFNLTSSGFLKVSGCEGLVRSIVTKPNDAYSFIADISGTVRVPKK